MGHDLDSAAALVHRRTTVPQDEPRSWLIGAFRDHPPAEALGAPEEVGVRRRQDVRQVRDMTATTIGTLGSRSGHGLKLRD